jgi:hypothetical protein
MNSIRVFALQQRSLRTLVQTVVIASALMTSALRPAPAQSTDTSLRLNFTSIRCVVESGDNLGGLPFGVADETYAVFWVGDIRGTNAIGQAFRTNVFEGFDDGETRGQTVGLWHPFGVPFPILNRDDIILLAAVLEEDDNRAKAVRDQVNNDLNARLPVYKASGLSHEVMVANLKLDMERAINSARRGDDRIGPVKEIRPSEANLQAARNGQIVSLGERFSAVENLSNELRFAIYTLTFQLRR